MKMFNDPGVNKAVGEMTAALFPVELYLQKELVFAKCLSVDRAQLEIKQQSFLPQPCSLPDH